MTCARVNESMYSVIKALFCHAHSVACYLGSFVQKQAKLRLGQLKIQKKFPIINWFGNISSEILSQPALKNWPFFCLCCDEVDKIRLIQLRSLTCLVTIILACGSVTENRSNYAFRSMDMSE